MRNSADPMLFSFGRLALGGVLALCVLSSAAMAQTRPQQSMLEAGTVIPVRLMQTLSSRDSRKGDTFTAKLCVEPRGSYNGLPAGTTVEGTVREARARRRQEPGVLDLDFNRVRLPGGRSYPIQGAVIGLDPDSVTKASDGRLVAKPAHKDDRGAFVGAGAGIGLLVGILRKRPVEDTLLGAGIGYLLGSTQRTRTEVRDVVLTQGTELGVRLDGNFRYADLDEDGEDRNADTEESARPPRRQEDKVNVPRGDDEQAGESGGAVELRGRPMEIGVLVGEEEVLFDRNARPVISEGKLLIPVLRVLRAARIHFRFDQDTEEWTIQARDDTVRVSADSRVLLVNEGRRVRLDTSTRRLNGTLYAPFKLFEVLFGQAPTWDAATRTVLLTPDEEEKAANLAKQENKDSEKNKDGEKKDEKAEGSGS